jgi:hypothetical protein
MVEDYLSKKLTAIMALLVSVLILIMSYFYSDAAIFYKAFPQQVFLDVYNRPIGTQDLLVDTNHNPKYRINTGKAETAIDFFRESMLSVFNYTKGDLVDGVVYTRFKTFCSEDVGESLYRDVFVNLGQQRVVLAQDGLVDAKFIGETTYVGKAVRDYVSVSGLGLESMTYKLEGKILITAHGESQYPTVYSFSALVQRALIQDKIKGYQIIELRMY